VTDWKLEGTNTDTWGNTVLWELGVAIGMIPEDADKVVVDADAILDLALEYIWRYRELEDN
jgi:hypothetical protein